MSNFKKFAAYVQTYNLELQCAMGGYDDAEIAIIGEFPTENDIIFNKPFSSGAGKYLWNFLRQNGVTKNDCYTTYAVKRKVSPQTSVDENEFSLWKEALEYELSLLPNLKFIICLGNAAMGAVLGFDGIKHYRGSVYDHGDLKVCCLENPNIIIRQPNQELIFAMDIKKAVSMINGDYKPHLITKHINPSYNDAMSFLTNIVTPLPAFSIDIEVIGGETACVGVGISAHEAMCINFRNDKTNVYTVKEEFQLLQQIAKNLDKPNIDIYTQNGNFDSYWMGFKDHLTFKTTFDTLLAHHCMYPLLPHNLGFLTSQYTNHPYYKDDIKIYKEGGDLNTFWQYNCTDCAITFAIAETEKQELIEQNLYKFFTEHVMKLQPHSSLSTVTGIAVDLDKKAQLSIDLKDDVNVLLQDFLKAARHATGVPDYEVNPKSPKQLSKLFYVDLGLKSSRKSTDATVRENLSKDPRVSIPVKDMLAKLGKFSEENKFLSTYVNTNIDPDGRFRAEFKQYGVSKAPGRLSSSKTLWGSGGNAQNQPYRAYEMYIADPGTVLIYFDLAQAEARYVGWDAHIEQWIEDFERARLEGGFDAHRSLAATMFNKPYEDVAEKDIDEHGNVTERFIAKRCRHGLNYRMMAHRLAQTTGLPYAMAAKNFNIYHKTNPELRIWWRELEKEARKNKMLFNALGRRFYLTTRVDAPGALNSIVAFKPQSTIGDKVQQVWYQCHEDDRWDMNKARIALNVHDALWGISTPEFADTALSIMKAYAEKPIMVNSTVTKKITPMIIPADLKKSIAGEDGIHRMSTMKDININAAQI